MERIIEICCGSYEDALNAYHGGAKRIELNNALHLGGLTPSLATLKLTKKNTNLKIITMVRIIVIWLLYLTGIYGAMTSRMEKV